MSMSAEWCDSNSDGCRSDEDGSDDDSKERCSNDDDGKIGDSKDCCCDGDDDDDDGCEGFDGLKNWDIKSKL